MGPLGFKKKYIILNFAYGFGPFLRALEVALVLNDEIQKRGGVRFKILVPHVYGEDQVRLIQEELPLYPNATHDEIVLEPTLGKILSSLFYGKGKSYFDMISIFAEHNPLYEEKVSVLLKKGVTGKTLDGKSISVDLSEIAFEIARSPQISFGIRPAFAVSFGHFSSILEQAAREKVGPVSPEVYRKAAARFEKIEQEYLAHYIGEPSTLDGSRENTKYGTEIRTPPQLKSSASAFSDLRQGVYLNVSGIGGLEKQYQSLFKDLSKFSLHIYSNKPELFSGSEFKHPSVVGHESVLFHSGRSGWSSVWRAFLAGKVFVSLPYHEGDDVEIYFNNRIIESLGIGLVHKAGDKQTFQNAASVSARRKVEKIRQSVLDKYGTLDGVLFIARNVLSFLEEMRIVTHDVGENYFPKAHLEDSAGLEAYFKEVKQG